MVKKQVRYKAFFIAFFIFVFFINKTYAVQQNFEKTNDEKGNIEKIITDSVVSVYENNNLEFTDIGKFNIFYSELNPIVSGISNKSKFNLNDYINLEVKNQKDTQECWAFSVLNSMETNLFIHKNTKIDFSERHMDYSTSSSIYGENIENKYNRPVRTGANIEVGLAYLTNGTGAVLENEMKFENNMNDILYSDLNIKPSYYVNDYIHIPNIYKKYDSFGNVNYFNYYGKEYSEKEIGEIRAKIKNYISKNGSIVSVMASKYTKGYNNSDDITKSTAYCCKDLSQKIDHAITIVGWDDNYSRENFSESSRPKSDGAYIVLQSYGEHYFEKGYMYISYEDCWIESSLYGICNSNKYDFDNLYQNDYYGSNGTMYLKKYQTGYLSTYFTREKSKSEILTKVSLNLPQRARVEVWLNPAGKDISENNLIRVSEMSEILDPGYHTINIQNTKLTGENFAIVIKQISENGDFYFNVEYSQPNKSLSEKGKNKISVDGKIWENLEDQGKGTNSERDLLSANLSIKGFTCEEIEK